MKYIFENLPIAVIVIGICLLMLYPYIGAGLLLAVLCFEAGHYELMAASVAICMALHFTMRKHIKPHHVPVKPSRASRRKKSRRKQTKGKKGGDNGIREQE